jgi:hypothetical protein
MRDPIRPLAILLLATCLLPPDARAQDSTRARAWEFDASVWYYIVPQNDNYLQPTVMADHDWLHLEGRYNYEAPNTGSAWLGYNFSVGSKFSVDFTPMAGAVIGGLTGAAPGYELTVNWWKLNFESDGEYVFDFGDRENDFFYNWSQLGIAPLEWLQLGISIQRTRAYDTDRDLQRGFFAGVVWRQFYFDAYVFNPDDPTPTVIIAVGASF